MHTVSILFFTPKDISATFELGQYPHFMDRPFITDYQTASTKIGNCVSIAVYIKRYLAQQAEPLQILFFQLFFSTPFLFVLSLTFEDPVVTEFSLLTAVSLFYQCILVAFLSYLAWFVLVSRYPVSLLHAFSFFTPVFGVIFSGILILGEAISTNLILALIMVSLGMVLVNYRPSD